MLRRTAHPPGAPLDPRGRRSGGGRNLPSRGRDSSHWRGSRRPIRKALLSNMWASLRLTGGYLRQCIGDFGWLDTPVPTWVIIVWTSCLAALTAAALILSAPCRRALPVLAVAVFAMPLALQGPSDQRRRYLTFQGRYLLPVAIGFPLVASTFHWRVRRHWVVPSLVLFLGIVLLIGAQVASFDRALHRYETGLGVPATTPVDMVAAWRPRPGRRRICLSERS